MVFLRRLLSFFAKLHLAALGCGLALHGSWFVAELNLHDLDGALRLLLCRLRSAVCFVSLAESVPEVQRIEFLRFHNFCLRLSAEI